MRPGPEPGRPQHKEDGRARVHTVQSICHVITLRHCTQSKRVHAPKSEGLIHLWADELPAAIAGDAEAAE